MSKELENEFHELIRRENAIMDFLQESALDGLWYWNIEKTQEGWLNKKFWAELGYDPSEYAGDPRFWEKVIDKDDLINAKNKFHEHLENPKHPYEVLLRCFHKNGQIKWIKCRGTVIKNRNSKPIRMFGIHQNVTDLKLSNEKLKDKIEELEQFSYAVSHDLKAPLRIINGYSAILAEDYAEQLGAEGRRLLDNIQENISNMNNLINELLSFSRISQQELKLAPIDSNQLIKECLINHIEELKKDNYQINIAQDLPIVFGDRALLKQIFSNLISNVIKFSRKSKSKTLTINWSIDKSNLVEFIVKDSGCGFDMRYYDKLFAVFQRLHSQQDYEGNGIGLALCKRIIEKHKGEIFAESEVGIGSTFHILVPQYIKEPKLVAI